MVTAVKACAIWHQMESKGALAASVLVATTFFTAIDARVAGLTAHRLMVEEVSVIATTRAFVNA